MKKTLWLGWSLLTITMIAYFGHTLFVSDDKSDFIVGAATHGHYQIEMACGACHSDPFGGPEVLQAACVNCHGEELDRARDEHPKKKFTNPRNAELIKVLDARQCITCHSEHQLEKTQAMGVTIAGDFCIHCHAEVGNNRDSHTDLTFDTCANAGCHNFHDNRALYEDFLLEHAKQPWLSDSPRLASTIRNQLVSEEAVYSAERYALDSERRAQHPNIATAVDTSEHGRLELQCSTCHTDEQSSEVWIGKPGPQACTQCHADEVAGFTSSKHGMRLSDTLPISLSPMKPALARGEFHSESKQQALSCNSCHDVHQLNTQVAAAQSCLGCHADSHSLAFESSPHGQLWQQALAGAIDAREGVSCATCHLPREQHKTWVDRAKGIREVRVQHNQNATLRPNEKMIRPVCMQCHGLEFSLNALADEALIESNFDGKPAAHVESIDWVLKRVQE